MGLFGSTAVGAQGASALHLVTPGENHCADARGVSGSTGSASWTTVQLLQWGDAAGLQYAKCSQDLGCKGVDNDTQ